MPQQNGNAGRTGGSSGSEIEDLIRHGRDQIKQMIPNGGLGGIIGFIALALAVLGAWTAYYTVPSDSVAVVQRFGYSYLKASTGLRREARMAGSIPKISPTARVTRNPSTMASLGIWIETDGAKKWTE